MRCNQRAMVLIVPTLLTLVVQSAVAKDVKTLKINAPMPELNLPGVDDKTYRLADFADAKVLVVIFTCNHCPTAQAYEQRIIQLHADYRKKGVILVAISPNDPQAVRLDELGYADIGDSFADMKLHAKRRNYKFPYLYDGETQRVSTAFGALATPHVFIFDRQRKLRYNGRIDDADVKPPKSHDARNAIDDLLAGRPVRVPKTRVRRMGKEAVPAIARVLKDSDVQMRRNATLVLIELAGDWTGKPTVDTRLAIPSLISATEDADHPHCESPLV